MGSTIVPKDREEKVNRIMAATLAVLAKKGYESTTINDIADAAGVSRGLLHYYFTDKEDIVAKAMTFGFGSMWDSAIMALSAVRSPEQLADSMIEVLKKNIRQNPDFTALLFEMWCSGRRSKKIRKVFGEGLEKVVLSLQSLLEYAAANNIVQINKAESEGLVRILIAMYHGIAMQLIDNPQKTEDEEIWKPVRRVLLSMFKET